MRSFDRDNVEVKLGACYCPNKPHTTDIVYLAPELSMAGGMAAQEAIDAGMTDKIELQELLARVFIRHGVVDWNLLDEDGKPLLLTPYNIEKALPYGKGGREVAERADGLYSEDILRPLRDLQKRLSASGRTNGSTSTSRPSTTKRRSPSSTAITDKVPLGG